MTEYSMQTGSGDSSPKVLNISYTGRVAITTIPSLTNTNGTITVDLPSLTGSLVLGVVLYIRPSIQLSRTQTPFAFVVNSTENTSGTGALGPVVGVGVGVGMQDPWAYLSGNNRGIVVSCWLPYPYQVQSTDTCYLQFNPETEFSTFYKDSAGNYGYVITGS